MRNQRKQRCHIHFLKLGQVEIRQLFNDRRFHDMVIATLGLQGLNRCIINRLRWRFWQRLIIAHPLRKAHLLALLRPTLMLIIPAMVRLLRTLPAATAARG